MLLVAVVCGTEAGRVAVDTKPEVYLAPVRTLHASLSAWQQTPSLGLPSFQVGLAPVAAVTAILELVGLPAWLVMRVLRCVLLLTGAAGAAALTRVLVRDGTAASAGRLAGVAYVLNPYVVVAGATLPVLWPYALLPWQVLALCRAAEQPRGWRWPAVFALTVVLATGQNAGAVPALQLVGGLTLVIVHARMRRARWTDVTQVLVRGAVLAGLASAYWLLPSVAAAGAGAGVVSASESPSAIAATSGLQEVVRGLGLWPLYGADGRGPWVPEHAGYLTSPWLVCLSFAVPAVALALAGWARGTARVAGVLTVCVSAVVMVGAHVVDGSATILGRAWSDLLSTLPALGVLRTTNKAGAALVLGLAVLIGSGAAALRGRVAPPARVLVLALLAAACFPAWSGDMFVSRVDVPRYWQQAAADLDGSGRTDRVWFLPGQVSARYRWSEPRPDDLGNSLFERPTLVATTIPITSPQGANLLSALDADLQAGTMPPAGLAAAARYLGAGDLLVRNDLRWEDVRGAPPALVDAQVAGSLSLQAGGDYGSAGGQDGGAPGTDVPALRTYSVVDPAAPVRLEQARGSVVIDGDGAALPLLAQTGLLDGEPLFRYASDLDAATFGEILRSGSRVVLTDTNRRTSRTPGVLASGSGPLLGADEVPVDSLVLGGADDQTVAEHRGPTASAERVGSTFGLLPWASPQNALDGDARTAWWFGDLGSAVGARVDVTFAGEQDLSLVTVGVVSRGSAAIQEVQLQAGGRTTSAVVGADGAARLRLNGVRADRMSLTVTRATTGDGALVGVDEIETGAEEATRSVRLPRTVTDLVDRLGDEDRRLLETTPVDVLLHRSSGGAGPDDDEETALSRDLHLPRPTTLAPSAVVALADPMPETTLDRAEGAAPGLAVTSSSQAFGLPTVRGSMALDGDEGTGWSPAEPAVGEWLDVRTAIADASRLSVLQPTDGRQVTSVRVEVDSVDVGSFDLDPGRTTIALPPGPARNVRVLIETVTDDEGPVRLLEVDAGGARMTRDLASGSCFGIATVNDRPVQVRLAAPASATNLLVGPCPGGELALGAGQHRWRPVDGWVVDVAVLRDVVRDRQPPAQATAVDVRRDRVGPGWSGVLPASSEATVLVTDVGVDARWRLDVDGVEQGAAQVVNGHAAAWSLPPGGERQVRLTYGPQVLVPAGGAISSVAIAGLVLLALAAPRRRTAPGTRYTGRHRPAVDVDRSGRLITRTAVLAAVCAVAVGPVGVVGPVLAAAGHLLGRVRPGARHLLLLVGVLSISALPVVWLLGNRSRLGSVSPALVTEVPAAHHLAALALSCTLAWAMCPAPRATPRESESP